MRHLVALLMLGCSASDDPEPITPPPCSTEADCPEATSCVASTRHPGVASCLAECGGDADCPGSCCQPFGDGNVCAPVSYCPGACVEAGGGCEAHDECCVDLACIDGACSGP